LLFDGEVGADDVEDVLRDCAANFADFGWCQFGVVIEEEAEDGGAES